MRSVSFDTAENKRMYENEARALLGAFFPGEEFEITVGDTQSESFLRVGPGTDRRSLKKQMYDDLAAISGKSLPWGSLTGVRPVSLVTRILQSGLSESDALEKFMNDYGVSREKAELAMNVALRQRRILSGIEPHGYSVYLGIPFCPTTCMYCSFTSYPVGAFGGMVDEYIGALKREIMHTASFISGTPQSLYIGGGTPTSIDAGKIDEILDLLYESFDIGSGTEVTFEAGRPDSITGEKLKVIKRYGIRRISINPQTMNQDTLQLIGRHHTTRQVKEAYYMARDMGFDDINMDLILGLPDEGLMEIEHTMDELISLDPDSITLHALAVKRGSRLNEMLKEKSLSEPEAGVASLMYDFASKALDRAGYLPYYLYRQKRIADNFENVGYAKEGKFCFYNVITMEEVQSVVALGAGAISKRVYNDPKRPGYIERCDNVRDIAGYIGRIDEMIERKRRLFG
ncbi:MAG: coproporphyrinogen dehydrogenase HemZ [Lachnospiraceae bacterium]|nr:coproporphyrinogen dehydrogenase HemZ [Lachnospiraceae bacterium]